ncbi:MAG: ABC transporter permease [Promethearchaeota archaeon]
MKKQSTNMIKYIIKRLLMMIPMLFLVLTFSWLLSHMMNRNPLVYYGDQLMDPDVLEAELNRIGYYDPWYIKLGNYYKNFFSGNWGKSLIYQKDRPVYDMIVKEVFPKTIELMIIPIILSPIIAVKLGLVSSTNKDKAKDTLIRILAIIGAGFPVFWIAALVQMVSGYYFGIFTNGAFDLPALSPNTPGLDGPGPDGAPKTGFRIIDSIIYNDQIYLFDTITHLIIPAIVITFVSLAGVTRLTRSSMLDVLDQDYIRTARAKGVLENDIINKHALRNALLPTSNLIIQGTATALLGSFFVEVTFRYTGFGYTLLMSILLADYNVINALVIIMTIILLTGTLVADVMYTIIDPRITYR